MVCPHCKQSHMVTCSETPGVHGNQWSIKSILGLSASSLQGNLICPGCGYEAFWGEPVLQYQGHMPNQHGVLGLV